MGLSSYGMCQKRGRESHHGCSAVGGIRSLYSLAVSQVLFFSVRCPALSKETFTSPVEKYELVKSHSYIFLVCGNESLSVWSSLSAVVEGHWR